MTNGKNRIFKFVPECIREKQSYDYVCVEANIYDEDGPRVMEKLLRIEILRPGDLKNELNMVSCNISFWPVILPILTFGIEIWILTENNKENILAFQKYTGRCIQRFPPRSPNITAFYDLGWLKITNSILVKKLLFVYTIIEVDPTCVFRKKLLS